MARAKRGRVFRAILVAGAPNGRFWSRKWAKHAHNASFSRISSGRGAQSTPSTKIWKKRTLSLVLHWLMITNQKILQNSVQNRGPLFFANGNVFSWYNYIENPWFETLNVCFKKIGNWKWFSRSSYPTLWFGFDPITVCKK